MWRLPAANLVAAGKALQYQADVIGPVAFPDEVGASPDKAARASKFGQKPPILPRQRGKVLQLPGK